MDVKISDVLTARFNEANAVREKPNQADFSFTLNRLSDEGLSGRLQALIGDITVCGKRLAQHMDVGGMKQYRGLITDFINEIVTHSHEFTRDNFLDRRGRHRVLGIVKVINQDLDDLAQELLKKEKDGLSILGRVDEILGLLLDLLI